MPGPALKPVSGLRATCYLYMRNAREFTLTASWPGGSIQRPDAQDFFGTIPGEKISWPGFSLSFEGSFQVLPSVPVQRLAGHPYWINGGGPSSGPDGERRTIIIGTQTVKQEGVVSGTTYFRNLAGNIQAQTGEADLVAFGLCGMTYYDKDNTDFKKLVWRALMSVQVSGVEPEDATPSDYYPSFSDPGYYDDQTRAEEVSFDLDAGHALNYPGFFSMGPA